MPAFETAFFGTFWSRGAKNLDFDQNFSWKLSNSAPSRKKVYKLSTNSLYFRGVPGDALQPTKKIRVISLIVIFVKTRKDEHGKRLVKAVKPNLKSPN